MTLPANNSINMTADFGYFLPGAAIGDYVWYDADNDGRRTSASRASATSPSLWSRTATATAASMPADVVLATTTTDANGGYLFTDLPAGTYFIDVTDTKGVLAGYSPSPGGFQSQPDPFKVVLTTSQVVNNADFGYVWPPTSGTAVVGDTVWWDTNQNGVRDPSELGIPGATVQLKNSGGTVIQTTTTDENGNYLFNNVTPGAYYCRM